MKKYNYIQILEQHLVKNADNPEMLDVHNGDPKTCNKCKKITMKRNTFKIKIYRKAKKVSESMTGKKRRFMSSCEAIKFTDLTTEVFIKVSYGMKKDYHGKLTEFTNEGYYTNHKDLLFAARAFIKEL